ncbi:MAG TPA: hypothetical protein VFI33_18780 [Puia sp.]|nr:hypothetical protein [Puia sp.]
MLKKILKEIKIIARTASYFAIVFILMMVMKTLDLRDYNIEFNGISQALLGALIMSKVIILMEYISLGNWVQRQPAIVDVILRTILYTAGVLIVIVLEKAFEKRHEADSYVKAISYVLNNRDIYHVWATTIGSAASILVYNAFSIVQRAMGKNGLAKLFFSTPLSQTEHFNAIKVTT